MGRLVHIAAALESWLGATESTADAGESEAESPPGTPNSCLSDEEAGQGAALWALLEEPQQLVHRRVESIEILDDVTARRRVSIDMSVRADRIEPDLVALLPGVPLTFLKKTVLKRFDLRDAAGAAVPMMSKQDNGRSVGNAIVYTAETLVQEGLGTDDPLDPAVEAALRRIVEGEPETDRDPIAEIDAKAAPGSGDAQQAVWAEIRKSDALVNALRTLTDFFVMIAVVPVEVERRRIFKFAYDEGIGIGAGNRLLRSIGWEAERLEFEAPAVALARSYHLEVRAPVDLDIASGRLRFAALPARAPSRPAPDGEPQGEQTPDVHFNVSDVDPAYTATADVRLRAERRGFVSAAALLALLVTALLAGGWLRLGEVSSASQTQVTAGALLIAPAIMAAFVIRPGEHRLASRLLLGVRTLLAVNVGSAIFAVGLLAARYGDDMLCWSWGLATIVAGLCAVGLTRPPIAPPR